MEAAETQTEAQRGSPSILQGSSRNSDADAKSSRDASRISAVKTARENGARVSLNGKEDIGGGDLDRSVSGVHVSGETMGVTSNVMLGGNEGGLEDSEMNGVSSLLKMQEGKSLSGLGTVLDKSEKKDIASSDGVSLVAGVCGDIHSSDAKEKREEDYDRSLRDKSLDGNEGNSDGSDKEEEENSRNEEHDFSIGDFVWGKIRSHPWWPGRIYDPLDASDYAKKVKQGDKILVAYFGDGTFAWCNPSQLKPLDDNFLEMSNQSSSKNFANAVENAMDEIGRLVDLKMTCSCVPKDNLIGFGRTLVVNAGIKEGLLIPEGGIDKFSSVLFEPAELLTELKEAAQVATATSMLEFTVLKSWLSAFYRSKGGLELPSYYDPKPVPGLEDKSRDWTDDYNGEVRIRGPEEEDWISSPRRRKYGQTTQNPLHKCQGVAVDGHYQRRKRKSLAEILEGQTDVQAAENTTQVSGGGEKLSNQATPSTKRKKRKSARESADDEKTEANEVSGGEKLSNQATSSTKRKKRKSAGETADDEEKTEANEVSGGEKLSNQATSSTKRKTRKSVGETADDDGKIEANDGTEGEKLDKPTSKSGGKKGKSVKDDNEGKHKMEDTAKAVADSAKRKTRKSVGETADDDGKIEVNDGTEGEKLDKPTSKSGGKKGKSVKDDNEGKHKMEDTAKAVADSGKPRPSPGRKKRKGSDEADVDNEGGGDMLSESDGSGKKNSVSYPSTRGRKRRDSIVKDDNNGGKNEEMKENSDSAEKVDGSTSKKGKTKELLREDSMPRERKRSKYLSPPYTNIDKGLGKEIEAEYLKMSSETQFGERPRKAASNGSPRVQLSGDRSQNQLFKETCAGHGSDSSGHQTPNQDQTIDPLLVRATANEVLSKIRSAALNPMYLKDASSLDMVGQFFSAFRSASYCSESNGEYSEPPPGRKRKSQKSEPGSSAKEQTQAKTDNSSLDRKSHRNKIRKSEEAKQNEPEEKQDATAILDKKTKDKESNGEAPRCALFVTFGPGSSLPSKNDLIKIYGKFGALNKQETEMFYTNYCARVVFLRSSEAEEAFNASQLSSPFGAANVTFRLRYLSAETKTRRLREISSHKPSSSSKEGAKTQELQSASQSSGSNLSELNFIKQKLQMVTSLIETSGGKIAPDMKSTLQGEMNLLMEKVSIMVSSSKE